MAVVFQATTSHNHTVKKSGLIWLLDLDRATEVWYVAVTPANLNTNFTLEKGVSNLVEKTKRFYIKMRPEDLV